MFKKILSRRQQRKRIKKAGHWLLKKSNRILEKQSLISNQPTLDKTLFEWIPHLEKHWQLIRHELDRVQSDKQRIPAFHELSTGQKRISHGNNWQTFVFYVLGDRYPPNCQRCPHTAQLLQQIPLLRNAWFSILAPHYHIPAHQGPTKGFIRVHLGLKVPKQNEQCKIRIDNAILYWKEGECIVFDDSYEHEVFNHSDEERVVLFLDIERPMRLAGRLLLKTLITLSKQTIFIREVQLNLQKFNSQ